MFVLAALLLASPVAAAVNADAGAVAIAITGLRNARGTIRICLTRSRSHFPDCTRDPAALSRTISADTAVAEFDGLPPGDYAVAVFHDENNNRKLDTFLGIPREGFGFSRNPTIRFGAPKFDKVDIRIAAGFSRTSVRMQYLL